MSDNEATVALPAHGAQAVPVVFALSFRHLLDQAGVDDVPAVEQIPPACDGGCVAGHPTSRTGHRRLSQRRQVLPGDVDPSLLPLAGGPSERRVWVFWRPPPP